MAVPSALADLLRRFVNFSREAVYFREFGARRQNIEGDVGEMVEHKCLD